MASAGGVWGGWLSRWGAHVARKHGADLSGDHVLLATLLGSDVGVLATGLAVSPVFEADPGRLGWIDAAGSIGMGLGTSIGLVGGLIATASMDFERPTADATPTGA